MIDEVLDKVVSGNPQTLIIVLMIVSLFKLIEFMVSKLSNKSSSSKQDLMFERVKDLHEAHLGPQARTKDGGLKWYTMDIPEKMVNVIEQIDKAISLMAIILQTEASRIEKIEKSTEEFRYDHAATSGMTVSLLKDISDQLKLVTITKSKQKENINE